MTAAELLRIIALAFLLALLGLDREGTTCHTDSECALAFPGTNGDPE